MEKNVSGYYFDSLNLKFISHTYNDNIVYTLVHEGPSKSENSLRVLKTKCV